jgi:hypothetical protein
LERMAGGVLDLRDQSGVLGEAGQGGLMIDN